MNQTLIAITSVLAALSLPAFAEDMPGMNMDATSTPAQQPAAQAPTAQATGTVRAIDNQKHVVTLAHGAVPSLQWPPMTMGFKATAEQLKGLKVGDRVAFEFHANGMAATIASIQVVQD